MKIKRYNQFINESWYEGTRGVNIEAEVKQKYGDKLSDLAKYVYDIAPWYLDNEETILPIYRGVKKFKYGSFVNILKVEPSKHNRTAANTYNFYIELMDNSPYWKDYPKRSKSIICSTNYDYADRYGEVFRVIPLKENETFAVCSDDDVFTSFPYLGRVLKNISDVGVTFSIKGFNDWLFTFGLEENDDYETIKRKIETNIQKIDSGEHFEAKFKNQTMNYEKAIKKYLDDGTLHKETFFEDILNWMSPENNEFRTIEYNRNTVYSKDSFHHRELWTEADCIMIDEILFQEIAEEYRNWGLV